MPKPARLVLQDSGETGGVTSDPLLLCWRSEKVALVFDYNGSGSSFDLEYSANDWTVERDPTQWHWQPHATMASMTADASGNLNYPVAAVRLKADGAGTATGTLYVLQVK